jgi:uncharacterized protein (TIGR00730 family)
MGHLIASGGRSLVYGGGHVGLMGLVADAAMAAGGAVHGVITDALLATELGHGEVTSLEVVGTMHERKATMADLADGFIMLPGGFGTLDEFFEALTWTQLGVHDKPCGILNVEGFFDPLEEFLDAAVDSGFVLPEYRQMVVIASDPAELLAQLDGWLSPDAQRRVEPNQR